MKNYYDEVLEKDLDYAKAKQNIKEYMPYYMARMGKETVYFYNIEEKMCSLSENGEVIVGVDESSIEGTSECDWRNVVITEEALDKIEKVTKVSNLEKVIVNGCRFEYDPNTFKITDDIMETLQNFPHEEDEKCFYMYYDESGELVIY